MFGCGANYGELMGSFLKRSRTASGTGDTARVSIEKDQLLVWAWDAERQGMRQLSIMRVCALICGRTGKIIRGVDLARWLNDRPRKGQCVH
jgi:hypothetical protein